MKERTRSKEQADLFCQACEQMKRIELPLDLKPAVIEALASLFTQLISEQHRQANQEINHVR